MSICELNVAPTILGRALKSHGFWAERGEKTLAVWPFFEIGTWNKFTDHWNDLLLDEYMRNGGTYRYRRYGQLVLDADRGSIISLPHEPYEQSAIINHLNGGFKRYFEPIQQSFLENEFFIGLMKWMGSACHDASGHSKWNIKLHPYRIVANNGAGEPSPEGLHRDGVDYISSFMIKRQNIRGGETIVTDKEENELARLTLRNPGDIVFGDDNMTKHGVSPIKAIDPKKSVAYRDILVVAFTKI